MDADDALLDLDGVMPLDAPLPLPPSYLLPNVYRDWSENGKICLTKAVLMALAAEQQCTDGELYRKYFEAYTLIDAEANLSSLERFDQMAFEHFHRRFYHSEDSLHEPDWISFSSPNDLNRLGELTKTDIVIFEVTKGRVPQNQLFKNDFEILLYPALSQITSALKFEVEVFHDYRCYFTHNSKTRWFLLTSGTSRLFELDSSAILDKHFSSVAPGPNALGWTKVDLREHPSLFVDEDDEAVENNNADEILYYDGCRDYVSAIANLLSTPGEQLSDPPLFYNSLSDFWEVDEEALYEAIGQKKCLIVYMVRRIKKKVKRHQRRFVTMAVAAPHPNTEIFSERITPEESCPVICIYNERFLYQLPESEAQEVLQSHFDTSGRKERLTNRTIWLEGIDKILPSAELEEALKKHDAKQSKKRRPRNLPPKLCRCHLCSRDKRYAKNMDSHGPERLCSTKHTVEEMLGMLNYSSPETLHALDLICELSIAAMDIESRTCQVHMKGPKPGPTVEYGEYDAAVLEGHVKKIQRPVMIAHTDYCVNEAEGTAWSMTVADDSTDAIFNMMKDYWQRVLTCRAECIRRKEELAQPIFNFLQNYKDIFYSFYDAFFSFEIDELRDRRQQELEKLLLEQHPTIADDFVTQTLSDSIKLRFKQLEDIMPFKDGVISETLKRQAWHSTIPGKIEVQLRRIVHSYTILTFCG